MASKNDYFKKVGRSTATTLSSPGYTTGDTSINIGATTNWPTDTGVTFAIDEVGSDGLRKSGTYNVFNGKVSGAGQVSEVEYVGGDPNRNYSAGATTRVYILVSAYRDNKFTDGILVQHDQDGTHKDITADSITTGPISATENIDVVDGKSIRDGNDNELITFSQTASAVNEITVKNAATGNAPQIQATGGDTNIDLRMAPKGTGRVKKGTSGGAIDTWEELASVTLGSNGTALDTGTFTTKRHLMIQLTAIGASTGDINMRFNGDTGNNYATQFFANGGASSSQTSQSAMVFRHGAMVNGQTMLVTGYVFNIAAYEKVMEATAVGVVTGAGAGNAPGRIDIANKWANTSNAITSVQLSANGNMAAGTQLVILGHD